MKHILFSLSLVCATLFVHAGEFDPKPVPGKEFMALHARNPETMRHTEFIGVKEGKAILKISRMSLMNNKKWITSYVSTDVENLPADWVEKHKPKETE